MRAGRARLAMVTLGLLTVLAGCSRGEGPGPVANATIPGWRASATQQDRVRLRGWRNAWMAALPAARRADASAVAAQGALFQPDRALPGALPPPGSYRCRVFKLGQRVTAMAGYTEYPPFLCRIEGEGELLSLAKITGSQRPVGLLFPDSELRAVFLGTLMLGDERRALSYGQDRERDLAGFMERIGESRWRLVLPYPHFESLLDVIELVPETPGAA